MANRNQKNKQEIKESVVLAGIDGAPKPPAPKKSAAKIKADNKVIDRQRRDVGNKIKKRETGKARAAAAAPKPRATTRPKIDRDAPVTLTKAGGLNLVPGSDAANELVDTIRRGGSKNALKAITGAIYGTKKPPVAGTRNANAGQKRAQKNLDNQGAEIRNAGVINRRQAKLEGSGLTPTEKRKHEVIIAKAIRVDGHLNNVIDSVNALGTGHSSYIADRELQRIAAEK